MIKNSKPNTTCSFCEKEFYKKPSSKTKSRTKRFFCNRRCYLQFQNTNKYECGRKNNKELNYKKTKKILYENRGSKCEICGYNNSNILQVHHIIPRSMGGNNKFTNLQIVCPNCHGTVHNGDSRNQP